MDNGNSVLGMITLMDSNSVQRIVDEVLMKLNMYADMISENINDKDFKFTTIVRCYIS